MSETLPHAVRCIVCGIDFLTKSRSDVKYCSKSCIWKATKGPEFNARIAREGRHKARARQVGKGKGLAYRKFYGRHEHRVVAEKMLGRPLAKGEIVHHVDGNKLNNDPSNLQVMTQGQHMREHGMGIPGVAPKHEPWRHRRKGEDDPNAKLSNDDIREIRRLVSEGGIQREVGARFSIQQSYVSQIVHRKRWGHVL